MRNLSHDPNIERHTQEGELIEPALITASEPASGSARWVAVQGRRLEAPRPTDPEGGLDVDTFPCSPVSPPVSTFGVSTLGDVNEPGSAPGTDVVICTPPPTEPGAHEALTPTTHQRSEQTCDTSAPMGALLPVGTHALRIVMTSSNGRRRWAVDVLVRKRSTATRTR